MRIQILYGYRGERTNEQFLPPGQHEVADDLGAYLIANGHARPVDDLPTPAPVVVVEPVELPVDEPQAIEAAPAAPDYESYTTAELRELAEAAGLEVVGTGRNGAILKADYIRALQSAEA